VTHEDLVKIPIFEKLTETDSEVLLRLWKPVHLKEGQVLFRKGERGDSMFLVEGGSLEITVPVEPPQKESEMRVSVLGIGEFVGELSLVDGLPRTATARALEETQLHEMKRDDFLAFLMQRPAVAISMVSEIGKRVRATNELVTSLASKNANEEIEESLTFGDRVADKVAEFGGSWTFIFSFLTFMTIWMGLNITQLIAKPFDEYPFILLNLLLSTVAALQGPVIMMSQNRAQDKDRLRADLDYQVNLKSELMLQQLHAKMDELRATEIQDIHQDLKEFAALKRSIEELRKIAELKDNGGLH
jgi:CRP/FNR family cyclic AMP-dependent transcriptional regulator